MRNLHVFVAGRCWQHERRWWVAGSIWRISSSRIGFASTTSRRDVVDSWIHESMDIPPFPSDNACNRYVLPISLTGYAGKVGMNSRTVAISIERSSPFGRIMLGPLRTLTDHDRDGFSGSFGGGDCDDRNAAINPNADDIPDNGIDEDCSGADATLASVAPVPMHPSIPIGTSESPRTSI